MPMATGPLASTARRGLPHDAVHREAQALRSRCEPSKDDGADYHRRDHVSDPRGADVHGQCMLGDKISNAEDRFRNQRAEELGRDHHLYQVEDEPLGAEHVPAHGAHSQSGRNDATKH